MGAKTVILLQISAERMWNYIALLCTLAALNSAQILPAWVYFTAPYEGTIYQHWKGGTNGEHFEMYTDRLLQGCNRFPI
jgi:hypothetical protein